MGAQAKRTAGPRKEMARMNSVNTDTRLAWVLERLADHKINRIVKLAPSNLTPQQASNTVTRGAYHQGRDVTYPCSRMKKGAMAPFPVLKTVRSPLLAAGRHFSEHGPVHERVHVRVVHQRLDLIAVQSRGAHQHTASHVAAAGKCDHVR